MNDSERDIRFTYHPPTHDHIVLHEEIRNFGRRFATYLDDNCPESRELSIAITKIEEAIMWANAAVARRDNQSSEYDE